MNRLYFSRLLYLAGIATAMISSARGGNDFNFDAPAGPQFTVEQKHAQHAAGSNVVPMVFAAYTNGAASVRIPAGDYRFGHERWGREGVIFPLEFSGLQRAETNAFTIDATGATFWFDLPDDQAPTCHFCVGFKNCNQVIFRGATLDRGTRGNIEGRITQIDFTNNRIEIRLAPGCTVPEKFSGEMEQRILPFKADGTFCAPLYALQSGGVHMKYRNITQPGVDGRCWVEMQDTALLDKIRDAKWIESCGEQGVLRVGDGVSCVFTVAMAVELIHCKQMTMDEVRVFVAKACGAESGGFGAHLWKNCYFGPRPGTSQWQGGEGYMFNATRHGTTLDNVTIIHTADDCANFHGYWSSVSAVSGNRVTFGIHDGNHRLLPADTAIGDRALFFERNTGRPLGAATVTAIEKDGVALDKPATNFTGAIVEWPDHECAGWTITNCSWHDNYQRILIQSGPGAIRNCTFARLGCGIELNFDFPYIEGGIPHDIAIENNTFTDVNPRPGGTLIESHFHTYENCETNLAANILLTGNTITGPNERPLALHGVSNTHIADNRIIVSMPDPASVH